MTENVASINQNVPVQDASEYIAYQNRLIGDLQQQVLDLEKPAPEPKSVKEILGQMKPEKDYKPVYEIRRMHRGDFKKLVSIIRSAKNHKGFQDAIASGDNIMMLNEGLEVILEELENDFMPWLADLAGMSEKTDEELPFGFDADVLNDLKANDNFLQGLKSATYFVMTGQRLFGR